MEKDVQWSTIHFLHINHPYDQPTFIPCPRTHQNSRKLKLEGWEPGSLSGEPVPQYFLPQTCQSATWEPGSLIGEPNPKDFLFQTHFHYDSWEPVPLMQEPSSQNSLSIISRFKRVGTGFLLMGTGSPKLTVPNFCIFTQNPSPRDFTPKSQIFQF